MNFYEQILRPLFFRLDPERAHHLALSLGARLAGSPFRPLLRLLREELPEADRAKLSRKLMGLEFRTPLGLAAGFDKDIQGAKLWDALGFAFVEFGTITEHAQPGNPKPRIFRLAQDQALINRMGFPSLGVEQALRRFEQVRQSGFQGILGVNIGKSKITPLDEAVSEYVRLLERLSDFGDYFVINVSSPNTPELRKLQEKDRLRALLSSLQEANQKQAPLLVKVAPDLSFVELDEVLEVALEAKLAGIVATNTTFAREGLRSSLNEQGGLSGAPLREKALAFVGHIHDQCPQDFLIMGVGGILSGEDARAFTEAGASLLQIYTGFIYRGPQLLFEIEEMLASETGSFGSRSESCSLPASQSISL